ncbi:hypothetical protein SUGI_0455030 [Cryptomeria japonica]|uniref:psbP domain-containing protein 4, chloroplastic isoform X1 n=1 Tax=Cryptomeria japonica TaxID=3369 RepID=UPI0024089CA7|nr:psbP domain-containing protein 4, chloroplastic isoform X1 [Cryptomeria japonica]GLJ23939.1 hypothetical protein SUGI_0455030 [Cryptomeria japonica]
MIVLAGCNYETKILGAASWSDSLSKYHLILRRQAFISGSRIGFKSPCTIKTSTRFSKNYRLPVLEATPLVAGEEENGKDGLEISRRFTVMLGFPMLAAMVGFSEKALAVKQLQLAGRVPGLSPPDENGMRTYHRPEAKSGGHGVGWSPIIPYTFTVPPDWEEVPVSIADLGGTEIDLRFSNKKEGNVSVVVAPVLRFADSDDNVKIENIGTPEKLIYAFGPELVGQNVEGKLKSAEVKELSGKTYYQYELEAPHALVSATAAGNRLYLMTVSGNGLQWKKYLPNLKQIADSFRVD